MGRGRSPIKRVHAAFAEGLGGVVCGAPRPGAVVAATPSTVTCQTCQAFMKRHPGTFPAWQPPAGWDSPALRVRACRACGCTDHDCSGCIERTGEPCRWIELDLCSACVDSPRDAVR